MSDRYYINPQYSTVRFSLTHFGLPGLHGQMKSAGNSLFYNDLYPEKTSLTIYLEPASIVTGITKLDSLIQSPALFDTKEYDIIIFRSTSAKETSKGLMLKGDLIIKNQVQEVSLFMDRPSPIQKDESNNYIRHISGKLSFNRMDFGLKGAEEWNRSVAGKKMIGDRVEVSINAEMYQTSIEYLSDIMNRAPSLKAVKTVYDEIMANGIKAGISKYDQLLKSSPDDVNINTLVNLGWILAVSGHAGEAIAVLERSWKDYPERGVNTKYRLADTYTRLGQYQKAIPLYHEIIGEIGPRETHSVEILRMLGQKPPLQTTLRR